MDSRVEYSVILAGKVGVGKSSIFSRIKTGVFPDFSDDTGTRNQWDELGLERLEHETTVNGREVKVSLWDTGGLERYDSMTANYYRHAHAVILVYDVSAEDTLYCLSDWIGEARQNSRWGDRIIFALWGSRCDKKASNILDEAVSAFISKHNIDPELSVKVSAKVNNSVELAFQALIENIHNHYIPSVVDSVDRDFDHLLFSTDTTAGSDTTAHKKCCQRSL